MIIQEKFDRVIKLFNNLEEFRGEIYPMALNLLKNGFEIEAYILILSTWNFANFRYVIHNFDLDNFINLINKLDSYFKGVDQETFEDANFRDFEEEIKEIYSPLSKIKGIEYTGASKIMHLKKPKLFVMWDNNIRKAYRIKINDYKGYIEFLEKMKIEFKNISISEKNRTKLIDEYNYISITRLEIIKNKIKDLYKKQAKGKKIKEDRLTTLISEQKKIEEAIK